MASNSPDVIRESFLQYLRHEFAYGGDWEHPITGATFKNDLIKKVIKDYKVNAEDENYRMLYALWATEKNRTYIANSFSFSGSSIKRRWNEAIDFLMLRLIFPDLSPDVPLKLTGWSN